MRRMQHTTIAVVAGILAGGLSAVPAAGDHASFYTESSWFFDITHMPDIDQRRIGLGGGGSMYCVPTSVMNLFAYFAMHGDPSLPPGVANWRADINHSDMSIQILNLGFLMHTDSDDGTTGDNAHDGILEWLPSDYIAISQWQTRTWSPKHQLLGTTSAEYHGYATMSVGWYEGGGSVISREGGHMMTAVFGARSGNDRLVGVRDPATDDGVNFRQSMYTTEFYNVTNVTRTPRYGSDTLDSRVMSRIDGLGGESSQAYMDGITVVMPLFALTDLPELNIVAMYRSPHLIDGAPLVVEYNPFPERRICRGVFNSDGRLLFRVCPIEPSDPDELYLGFPGEGKWELIDSADAPLDNVVDFAVGRRHSAYIFDREHGLVCWDTDRMQLEGVRQIPFQDNVHAVAWTPSFDTGGPEYLWMLSAENDAMVQLDSLNFQEGQTWVYEMSGAGLLSPETKIETMPNAFASFWAWTPGDCNVYRIDYDNGVMRVNEALCAPFAIDALSVNDDERVLISAEGCLHEYEPNEGGGLSPAQNLTFDGQPSGSMILLAKSWSNLDQKQHSVHAWRNELPTNSAPPVADCVGDFNEDGAVDVEDLLDLLAAWGTSDPYADIAPDNGDGTVDVNDLLRLLQAWGECPDP